MMAGPNGLGKVVRTEPRLHPADDPPRPHTDEILMVAAKSAGHQ